MPSTTDTTAGRRKKPSVLDLAAKGVRTTLERPGELQALTVSTVERHGVRSKLQLDRSLGLLPLEHIKPDPNQPRKVDTTSEDFRDLVASVRDHGVMQPITVRYMPEGDHFQIVSGERRYRAARAAGLMEIHAVVIDRDDARAKIQQIEENLHRTDLNPIEEAAAIRWLMDANGYTQQQVAARIHKSKGYVSKVLAIDEHLTRQEKTHLGAVSRGNSPGLSLIYEALQSPTPELRAAILTGKIKRDEAMRLRGKSGQRGRPKAFVEHIDLDELGATVTIRFPKKARVAPEAVLEALDVARAVLKRKPPR